jgi:hypothetical protein
MIDARAHWWSEVDHFISKSPLQLQQEMYTIAWHTRCSLGGETACCGTFLPHFVANLPTKDRVITENEGKIIIKLFKIISAGCRRMLRLAAEMQLGPLGVNLRQRNLTEYFKPIADGPTIKQLDERKKNKEKYIELE